MNQKATQIKWRAVVGLVALFNMSCSVFGLRSEEQPKYEVLKAQDNKEIRRYSPYIVAKTKVKGSFESSQNEAFRILAGYIFGGNQSKQKIAMTAPVTQTQAGEKISMTAPVTQTKQGDEWVMTFSMPSRYTMEQLPKPNDPRVEFEEVPSRVVAALKFTGFWSEEKNKAKESELKDWVDQQGGYTRLGEPRFAGYDPPWTIPFLRRNEILWDLESKPESPSKP